MPEETVTLDEIKSVESEDDYPQIHVKLKKSVSTKQFAEFVADLYRKMTKDPTIEALDATGILRRHHSPYQIDYVIATDRPDRPYLVIFGNPQAGDTDHTIHGWWIATSNLIYLCSILEREESLPGGE